MLGLIGQLGREAQLDGGGHWHFADAECDSGMAPFGAKDVVQEFRGSVQYLSLALEAGGRMDESVQAENLFDFRQFTCCSLELGHSVDSAESSSLVAFVDG